LSALNSFYSKSKIFTSEAERKEDVSEKKLMHSRKNFSQEELIYKERSEARLFFAFFTLTKSSRREA
jgi:hypothetical protein